MTLYNWVQTFLGAAPEYDFIVVLVSALIIVIAVTLSFSMILGIVFSIFKR